MPKIRWELKPVVGGPYSTKSIKNKLNADVHEFLTNQSSVPASGCCLLRLLPN